MMIQFYSFEYFHSLLLQFFTSVSSVLILYMYILFLEIMTHMDQCFNSICVVLIWTQEQILLFITVFIMKWNITKSIGGDVLDHAGKLTAVFYQTWIWYKEYKFNTLIESACMRVHIIKVKIKLVILQNFLHW